MTFVPHTDSQRADMLKQVGADSIEDLLRPIPANLRLNRELRVPPALGEVELWQTAAGQLAKNQFIPPNRVFAGGGVYPHHVPAVVDELGHRGEFYSAYTPYQPEVSQGMLQSIYEYQSYICMLTGMEVSNASGYDGGTTLADGVLMAYHAARGKRPRVLCAPFVDRERWRIVETYNLGPRLTLQTLAPGPDGRLSPAALDAALSDDVACVVFQYPDCLGYLEEELAALIETAHRHGALAVFSYYPFASGLLKSPGELGADIVSGDAQCFGNPMAYGGPLLGFIACREKLVRNLPGRLIGRTVCERRQAPGEQFEDGEAFVMTLQAREQHIRRDKAMSNICTNQALMALRSCIYLGAVGKSGLEQLAGLCHANALHAHGRLTEIDGVEDYFPGRSFFNEFTLRFPPGRAKEIHDAALAGGMLA
ncbi:MAG TPA: aminomethyl-transferring glycine dehydrogenase subunit GcvPA, partial [Firmicutes bacterium]|nr:aminomethyl-transferring glycine dehydrogenase subunit GcvPA [Bacillota bacterium]